MRTFTVPSGAPAERLDTFVSATTGLSRSAVQRLLKAGQVTVGGRVERSSYLVQPGDHITLADSSPAPASPPPPPELPVIYEDADMLVVDKPAGLIVHPGAGRRGQPTVADFARQHTTDTDTDRPGIVHRLDQDTSGLLVIAKTAAAKHRLQSLWRRHEVAKTYRLLVSGRLKDPEATINLPIGRDPAHPLRQRVLPGGRPASTRYRVLFELPGYTYVEAYPATGRTHQLRVHFAALGHPIVGDRLYGTDMGAKLGLHRQFLHAVALELPAAGHLVKLTSPLPPDLTSVLTRLGAPYN